MKTITIRKNGKDVSVNICYSIFDAYASHMKEPHIFFAKNSREALAKYLNHNNFIKSKTGDFCVSPFFMDEEHRYLAGRRVWYKAI